MDELRTLPIDQMQGHPENPRTWPDRGLEGLGRTMLSIGTVQPVIVRPIPGGDPPYQIVAGERRWRAAKLAGIEQLTVIVRELGDADALKQMLVENLQRKGLNPIEMARLLSRLCTPIAAGGAGMQQREAAALFGKGETWTGRFLQLLRLPADWQAKVAAGEVSPTNMSDLERLGRKDPAIYDAVRASIQKSPASWNSQRAFKRSLQALWSARRSANNFLSRPAESQAATGSTATGTPARDIVADICECIHRLTTVEDLERVRRTVDQCLQRLAGTSRLAGTAHQASLRKPRRCPDCGGLITTPSCVLCGIETRRGTGS